MSKNLGAQAAGVQITGYHAHVYFDETTVDQARALCERARAELGVVMGRVHERTVGPHPRWSCQLSFEPEQFAQVVPWLALNRNGLTVFTHPLTGDVIAEHTDYAIWMGECLPLDVDFLREQVVGR